MALLSNQHKRTEEQPSAEQSSKTGATAGLERRRKGLGNPVTGSPGFNLHNGPGESWCDQAWQNPFRTLLNT
ncbi:hypothetical protein SKAU_G00162820 [Synaphobranchus kaupii]|uniref:Uncharacterized protein n=1 Tax=Synaphobranchus kaupii TaxID=118154 RepID=A0A9Q1FJC6_SYNKA|nr:hypothetical protein SKAU_G00162820 [Synaphobranchus kaupii]